MISIFVFAFGGGSSKSARVRVWKPVRLNAIRRGEAWLLTVNSGVESSARWSYPTTPGWTRNAAQVRPRCFAAETVGVIAGGDQQDGGRVGTDTGQGQQTRPRAR